MSWTGSQSWGGASDAQQWGGASEQWGGNSSSAAKGGWDANQGKGGGSNATQGKGGGWDANQGKGGGSNAAQGKGGKDKSWESSGQGGKGGKDTGKVVAPSWGAGAGKGEAKVVKPPAQSWKQEAPAQSWGEQSWGQQDQAWTGGNDNSSWGPQKGGKGAGKPSTPAWLKDDGGAALAAAEQFKATLAKLTTELTAQETMTNPSLEAAAKLLATEEALPGSIKSIIDSMEKTQAKLNDTKASLTKEVADARKAGSASAAVAQDMAKVLIKCNALCNQVTEKLGKLKPKHTKAQNAADLKTKEAKDTTSFKPLLAKATADITTAVAAVAAVGKQADPVVLNPPEEGEELDKKIASIEKVADEAIKKCETARNDLNEKFKAIQAYAPEAKKNAHASLMELQKKLADRIKTCHVYKSFKKEFPKLKENAKAVTEVTEKLAGLETHISKADKIAQAGKLAAKQVQAIDEALDPVQLATVAANATISMKLRGCDAATREKLEKLRARSDELKKKADAVILKIKATRDVVKSEEGISTAKERLAKVEEAWTACQDAEMPFLTGVEILDDDVSEPALKACSDTASEAAQAVSAARSWVNNHLRDSKGYEKELAAKTAEALTPLSTKIADLDTKINGFRKDTNERKIIATVAPVLASCKVFDKKVKAAEGVGKALASSSLEDETVESISEIIEKTKAALVEANAQSDDAKKVLEGKKREAKLPNHSEALDKIHGGLKAGQDKLSQLRSKMSAAEKLVKTKNATTAGEKAMEEAEADVEKAQKLVPAEGKSIALEKVAKLDEACATASKSIKVADHAVHSHINAAPPKCKEVLQKLLERKKAADQTVHKIKADTKERREETLSDHYLEEAETKTKAAEAAGEKLNDAEGPFLTGADLPLKKLQEQLAACQEAAAAAAAAMKAAMQYSTEKAGEVKFFVEASMKKVKGGIAEMAARVKKVSTRLDAFTKEMRQRAKDSKVAEAAEKVDEVEASLKKTLAAAAPFEKEGAESMSEAEAAEPLKVFMDLDKETAKQTSQTKRFVQDCEKEQKGNATHLEALKKLNERLTKASQELADKKKITAPHEEKALGTRLVSESKEQIGGLEAEVKKATEACAPLLEHGGGDFLVATSIKTLVAALSAHMKEKELAEDALFKEAGAGKKIKKDSFVKYLSGLPEAIGHDELNAFSEERRAAIFQKLSADGKYITEADFKGLFVQRYYCIKAVTVTNQFEVDGCETVLKLEAHSGVLVDILSAPQTDETTGCVRAECSVDGKKGWVTLSQQNKSSKGDSKADSKRDSKGAGKGTGKGTGKDKDKGKSKGKGKGKGGSRGKDNTTRFLVVANPFKQFCNDTEKILSDVDAAVTNAERSLNARMKQGGEAKEGSRLKECRDEMAKLKEPMGKVHKEMRELLEKFRTARSQHHDKEKTEMQAHVLARNIKEAAPFIEGPQSKMEIMEAAAKAEEEAAAPMISLAGEELEKFATPSTVWQNVEKHVAVVQEKATEVREALKEQQKAVGEVNPPTDGSREAQKQLKNISQKLHDISNKANKTASAVRHKCHALVKAHLESAAEGIRKHVQEKSLTVDGLFESLKDGEKIPQKAFCKLVQSLELSISDEHAKLLAQKMAAEGISKDAFIKFVVIHYKVLKTIVFTDAFDIKKCKTLGKVELGAMVDVLEGPKLDEASEMVRIRGRATIDGKEIEGWVTVSGSNGTAFLEKVAKPAAKCEKKAEAEKTEKKEEAAKLETKAA